MRYLLDTNIISNLTRPKPSTSLVAWMADQADDQLFISSLTVAEIRRGVLQKPAGKRRDELEAWFSGRDGPLSLFAGRILPFDEKAALVWGRFMANGKTEGQPRSALDTIVAAVAAANDCIVVTDNDKHFADVQTLNPLR
jgi:toxin FitB